MDQVDVDLIDKAFAINVRAVMMASKLAAAAFGSSGGVKINIGRYWLAMLPQWQMVYAATKAAVEAVTGVLAARACVLAGIQVNAVAPGPVATELLQLDEGFSQFYLQQDTAGGRSERQQISQRWWPFSRVTLQIGSQGRSLVRTVVCRP